MRKRSAFSLAQEDLRHDPWKMLVICIMLNCTKRKQVEQVAPSFFSRWPTACDLLAANIDDVSMVIKPLGFQRRRAQGIANFSYDWLNVDFKDVRELRSVGEYAARCYEIFVLDHLGDSEPNDGPLSRYWRWAKGSSILDAVSFQHVDHGSLADRKTR